MTEHEMDPTELEALADHAEAEELAGLLDELREEVEVLLFVAPGCPACPHQIRSAATLALASPRIGVELVDATRDPETAIQYEVRSVPTTVVNDELILVGVKPPRELAYRILELQGPGAQKVVFTSLVESGRVSEAAERLWEPHTGPSAVEAFFELWSRSALEGRMGLMLVAEEAMAFHPGALDALVPRFAEGLAAGEPWTQDPPRRGDTADLLGRIGHPQARSLLEALAADSHPEVAEAAQDALEEWEEAWEIWEQAGLAGEE